MILKKIKLLNIILLILICGVFSGCSWFDNNNTESYRLDISQTFQINIPKEWEFIYHNQGSLGGFQGEGTCYDVFQPTERDEEFFSSFSDIKNADIEDYLAGQKKNSFDNYGNGSPIELEYWYDAEQPYEWFFKEVVDKVFDNGTLRKDKITMIYQSQKLYVMSEHNDKVFPN